MSDVANVSPTEALPTHHVSLTDGGQTLGLLLCDRAGNVTGLPLHETPTPATVMRMSQGAGGYGDFELPYTPVVQQDWSGGRGQEDLSDDVTRYNDGYHIDTRRADGLVCGPLETKTTGIISGGQGSYVNDGYFDGGAPGIYGVYMSRIAGSGTRIRTVTVKVSRTSSTEDESTKYDTCTIAFYVYSDATGGWPQNKLYTIDSVIPPGDYVDQVVDVPIDYTFGGANYWIGFWANGTVHVKFGTTTGAGIKRYSGGDETYQAGRSFAILLSTARLGNERFFEYHGALFAIQQSDDFTAPKLFLNGYRGMALTNAADPNLLNFAAPIPNVSLEGKIVRIVSGSGSEEERPWRVILGNTTTFATVDPLWYINHDATTEYAIYTCDTWTEVTGHGLTKPVTDVLIVDNVIYFAQGDKTNIRRWQIIPATGAWDTAIDDGTNKATFLKLIPDKNGVRKVWKATGQAATLASSDVKPWGTPLVFAADVVAKDTNFRITNVIPYSTPILPYVFKEDCFGSVNESVWAQIPLYELSSVRSENNGIAACQLDVYLFFSLLDGIERYYQGRLDDVGPNRDLGLPYGRQGLVTCLIAYANGLIAVINGGRGGTSSIMFWNKTGWCELYRAQVAKRIKNAFIQVIPGIENPDRLWFNEEQEVFWIPIAVNPRTQANYTYKSGSRLESSRITGSLREVVKYWPRIKVFSENLSNGAYVTLSYQTDRDQADQWHTIQNGVDDLHITQSPSQEVQLAAANNIVGRWLRYALTLYTNDPKKTPRVKAVVVDSVTRIPAKRAWSLTCKVSDEGTNLNGDMLYEKAAAYMTVLRGWADSRSHAAPLIMRDVHTLWDSIYVFVEPASIQAISQQILPDRSLELVIELTLREA